MRARRLIALALVLSMAVQVILHIAWWKAQVNSVLSPGGGWTAVLRFDTFWGEPVLLLALLLTASGATLAALYLAGRLDRASGEGKR